MARDRREIWFEQLLLVMVVGAFVYLGLCSAMGVNVMRRMKS